MKALDIKMLRDLRRMWSQALTVALVVASGVAGVVTFLSAVESLEAARARFYAEARFADVFADLVRAPDSVAATLNTLAGVAQVQTTIEHTVRIDLEGTTEPAIGRLIGLDSRAPTALNTVSVRLGRMPNGAMGEPSAPTGTEIEALVSEGFAQAHGLAPGSTIGALIEGRRRTLRITGTAVSPEYVFAGLHGAPDPKGFGAFWVDKATLAAALDMRGAFNRVAIRLAPQSSVQAVISEVEASLQRWGGRPPYPRADQISEVMLNNEIREQRVLGTILPAIFAAVAAFLLNVVISRLVSTQRGQIAALKALGYGNSAIAGHYLKLVGLIAALGLLIGLVAGNDLGRRFAGLFAAFFHFPDFEHRLSWQLVAIAAAATTLTAVVGTLHAIRATVRLPPAVAMQAQAPSVGRRSRLEGLGRLVRHPAGAMIVRNMVRRPWRTGLSIVGMAAAMAIVILGHFVRDAIEEIERSAFSLALRGDLIVSMIEPVQDSARHALARLPGVIAVESGRDAAVRLRHGHLEERARIQGGETTGHLRRVMDVDGREAAMPLEGLMLTDRLAAKLAARPGDQIEVQVLEGRMPIRHIAMCCTVRDMMGLNAYMERGALNRLMGEGDLSSQFTLALEQGTEAQTLQATRSLPRVAGTFSKATLRANMQQVSGRNVRIMSTVMTAFAAVIAVGIVYNAMRIALSERSWELASLRVLGFRRAEVSGLLLGEMAIAVVLALPLGMALGWLLVHGVAQLLASDQFLFPVVIQPRTYALAALSVGMAALATSAVVRRHIDHLDLVAVLKTRE